METNRRQILYWILTALVLVGAINWGLIGAFNFNLVHEILMGNTIAKKIIYVLVGLAGIYLAFSKSTYMKNNQEVVFPSHLLNHCLKEKEGKEMNLYTKYPNTTIVYWVDMNGDLSNSGTSETDAQGLAKIVLAEPKDRHTDKYWMVPREVHYRAVTGQGTLSEVETVRT